MKPSQRDRLLRRAWGLDPSGTEVAVLSRIAREIGVVQGSWASAPTNFPYTLRNLAAAAGRTSRARGGGGTSFPGEIVLRRAPDALRQLGAGLRRIVLVSGTNGKTTTASMIAAVLTEAGHRVAHNRAGANLPAGVATALLDQSGEIGVFEVDEAWLPLVAAELSPTVIVLGNLFRDRLDAYGELEALARAWREMIGSGLSSTFLLNSDDPSIAGLGQARGAAEPRASFFGVADRMLALADGEEASDALRCRDCEQPLSFGARLLSHLGHYACETCGTSRPRPETEAHEIHLNGVSGSRFCIEGPRARLRVELGLPGLYNVYNALAAAATGLELGVEPAAIARGLAAFEPVFGRGQRVRWGSTELLVMLMKNPAGANELIRTLQADGEPRLNLLIALNDRPPDGRDISWIWDADFEALRSRVGLAVCSGIRAAELALRLKYAGWPRTRISVEPGIAAAIERGIGTTRGRLTVLPTYTALLEVHEELASRGLTRPFWHGAAGSVPAQGSP